MWRNYVKGMFDIDFAYATRNTLRQKRKLRRLVDEREEIRRDLNLTQLRGLAESKGYK
jgi:hypothetical protein